LFSWKSNLKKSSVSWLCEFKVILYDKLKNLGSTLLHATNDDMECGMWNVGWCIDVKSKDRFYESWNGSMGMEKKMNVMV
jgi:hypothetical protein